MLPDGEPIASRVAAAAARTVAAGSARLFAAWCTGSPEFEAADQRCEGEADFTVRRTRVTQSIFLTDRNMDMRVEPDSGDRPAAQRTELGEQIFDGANIYTRVGGSWTIFFPAEPTGPRGQIDPLWPLDALFGAGEDAIELGMETVRDVPATHCRLTVDLGRADAALPAGVTVPAGPYRSLSRLPAELWIDAAGLARRIAVNDGPTTPADRQLWSVIELWDFGLPVNIAPPGPDEVISPREAYRRAEEEQSG